MRSNLHYTTRAILASSRQIGKPQTRNARDETKTAKRAQLIAPFHRGFRLFDYQERLPLFHPVARFHANFFDDALSRCPQLVLHLHRFENHDALLCRDVIAHIHNHAAH